ncbi:hypothetical protein [Nocardiopsis sp. CC223A]|uniref:hypothetical protein n=1 Tax=Nocardiopsis sp. CC223A TaxID=3044051 RepID=UPI00278C2F58|nr:hypothetical protein [Nocardiopsis sp. CC223A]
MSGVPPRPLPGHLFPLSVQWFAQDHPRVYGAILGAALSPVPVLILVTVLADDLIGVPVPVLWVIGVLIIGLITATSVWGTEQDVRKATVDGDRERFRKAQRLVREGRLSGDAETDRVAERYARLVVAAPLGHSAQALLAAVMLAVSTLSGGLNIADGRYSFAVFHVTVAVVAALYLTVGVPLIEHRKRRARALSSPADAPEPEEGP